MRVCSCACKSVLSVSMKHLPLHLTLTSLGCWQKVWPHGLFPHCTRDFSSPVHSRLDSHMGAPGRSGLKPVKYSAYSHVRFSCRHATLASLPPNPLATYAPPFAVVVNRQHSFVGRPALYLHQVDLLINEKGKCSK